MQYYIYTLSDPTSNEIKYIGKTKNIKNRLNSHMTPSNLKNTWTAKSKWLKHLKNNNLKPIIETLDTGNKNNIDDLEIYWISQFKTWGFNLKNETEGGISPIKKGDKLKKTHIESLKKSHPNKKPVCQYTLDNVFVEEFESINKAIEKTKIKHISCCCNGNRKSAGGFYFRHKNNYFPYVKRKDYWTGAHHSKETKEKLKMNHPLRKVIYQYSIETDKKIDEYLSLHEASEKTHLERGHISNCCKGKKNYNSVGGYYFRFKDEYFPFIKQYASIGILKKRYNIKI